MLQINLPHSMWDYKISGVYKILFSDGSFYIGCSKHLRSRAAAWDSLLSGEKDISNEPIGSKMLNKINEKLNASLCIVELCSDTNLKDREAFYLNEENDNPLMLSQADCSWTPVLQYNKESGVFIKRHISISSAANYNKTSIGRIQDVLNGVRTAHRGMIFIYETEYKVRRDSINKGRWKGLERTKGKEIIMLTTDNIEVGRFKMLTHAAKMAKCCTQNIRRVLSGSQKTAGGYVFKFAQ